jgi:hypothetical protein
MVALALLMFRALSPTTSYWYILLAVIPMVSGMALAMSPMTAAIMSAVPPHRAGAGSAMNDVSRELGAALGVAIMGSVAASQYAGRIDGLTTGLAPDIQDAARTSLAGALQASSELPGEAGRALLTGAQTAFIDGVHLAVTVGGILAIVSALIVLRFLPRHVSHEGAEGTVESIEDVAELGIAGTMPVFADTEIPDEASRAAASERGAGGRIDQPV